MALEITQRGDVILAKDVCSSDGFPEGISVGMFVVDGLLIDAGATKMAEPSGDFWKESNISQVVITHNHDDHAGGCRWIQDNLNIPIYLHPDSIEEAGSVVVHPKYGNEIWGVLQPYTALPMPKTISTASGKYSFETIDSPGHHPCHIALYERNQKWLFTGDLYLGTKMFFCYKDENIKQLLVTLEKMLELDFDTVFCAHAGFVENGKIRLQKKLDYLKNLQLQVSELREGGMSDKDITAELFPFDFPFGEVSEGDWSPYNIIRTI